MRVRRLSVTWRNSENRLDCEVPDGVCDLIWFETANLTYIAVTLLWHCSFVYNSTATISDLNITQNLISSSNGDCILPLILGWSYF